jgi:beta-glucosidase
VVFGEDPYAEFQGDRDTLEYGYSRPDDVKLLKKLQAAGIPVVSIFLSGRPLWVNPELNASDAFIAAWLPGSEAGGVADVIFRAADGSIAHDLRGKLPFSWPRTAIQTPLNIGDEGYDPLFPFGFGLTYSDRWDLRELPEETGIVGSSASRTVYFKGGPVAPWKLFVGDGVDWAVPVAGSRTTTRHSDNLMVTAVDRQVQEDARLVRWSGESVAMVYLRADEAIDLTREANGGIALVFDVLVEEPPASSVMLGMICGDECGSRMDITGLLGASPVGEWQTLTIRLSCFADVAVDLAHVTTPFLIATDGELTLRFADVRLESAAEGEVPCP